MLARGSPANVDEAWRTGWSEVHVSSGAARTGSPGEYVDYAATKGAVDTFTVGLASEVAAEGIRVNAVRPGFIYTTMHAKGGEPGRVDRVKAMVPMQRGGQPEEVAASILWLLSEEASFVTGAILDVSGGRMKNKRSSQWFQTPGYTGMARRAWLRSEGFPADVFDGKPVIGICNSWSELNNCNVHLREVAEAVKRGVLAAGGFPLEFPTISLGEMFMRPTTMLFRNLMAMDVEESIRANPLDGVVLLCGCDKTTPAQLMGAASADIPAIVVPGGRCSRALQGSGSAPAPTAASCSTSTAPESSPTKSGAKSKAASRAAPGIAR